MNKELIEQIAVETGGTQKYVPAVWQFFDAELHTFAERLIRECAEVVKRKDPATQDCISDLIHEALQDAARAILSRFDIKE